MLAASYWSSEDWKSKQSEYWKADSFVHLIFLTQAVKEPRNALTVYSRMDRGPARSLSFYATLEGARIPERESVNRAPSSLSMYHEFWSWKS